MKALFSTILFIFLLSSTLYGQEKTTNDPRVETLIGEWVIDLRPTPESEGYFQTFRIESIQENTFKGTFYGSELENPLLNKNWEKLYFSFTTRDASNEYYHSGYLLDGILYGISYCPNRKFTAPWTGNKK